MEEVSWDEKHSHRPICFYSAVRQYGKIPTVLGVAWERGVGVDEGGGGDDAGGGEGLRDLVGGRGAESPSQQ